jgi:hypothetical protein
MVSNGSSDVISTETGQLGLALEHLTQPGERTVEFASQLAPKTTWQAHTINGTNLHPG